MLAKRGVALGFYESLEDRWYKLLESLDKRGIPIRAITDPIESAGLPSLPVAAGLVLVILAAVVIVALPAPSGELQVKVTSQNQPVKDASVAALFGTTEITGVTDAEGVAKLRVPLDAQLKLSITKKDCEKAEQELNTTSSILSEPFLVTLACKLAPPVGACLQVAEDIDQVQLRTPDGGYPKACTVSVKNADGSLAKEVKWNVKGDKISLPTYSQSNCPKEGQEVTVSCSDYQLSASMEDFMTEAASGQVELKVREKEPPIPAADVVYNTFVKVTDSGGKALAGMRVSAVDTGGTTLNLRFSNVVTQTVTDSGGAATLVLPRGTTYQVKAEDTGVTYATKVSNVLTASSDTSLTLSLEEGFKTTLTVVRASDNSPLSNAYVEVYDAGTLIKYGFTGNDGKATFQLEKKTYKFKVFKTNFVTTEVSGDGGALNIEAKLVALDDSNSGIVIIRVINARGLGEPLSGVSVTLIDSGGTELESTTDNAGEVNYGRQLAGTYTVRAEASGSPAVSESFTVAAGNTSRVELKVEPPQVKLKVITKVNGEALNGVKIDVFDITFSKQFPELLISTESKETRSVEVVLDKNTEVYLKGSFEREGRLFGPVVTTPIKMGNDTTVDLDLTEVKQNISVKILDENKAPVSGSLDEGKNYFARVALDLPWFDPQKKEPYESVILRFFVGDQGDLGDIAATPITIRATALADYAVEDPVVSGLTLADSFFFNVPPVSEETGASKYFEIIIGGYREAKVFNVDIPLHVRSAIGTPTVQLHYLATWRTAEGTDFNTNNGFYTNIPVTINTKTSGWRSLEAQPNFYLYNAWLSTDKAGAVKVGDWSVTKFSSAHTFSEGGTFYLQVRAKARVPSSSYSVDLRTVPETGFPYAKPIAYSGRIVKTNGVTQEIFPVTSIANPNSISPPADSKGVSYSVDADDELQLAIVMKTQLPNGGTGNLQDVYGAQTQLFNDQGRQDLLFNVRDLKDSEQTPVSNVVAQEFVASNMYGRGRLYDQTKQTIPSFTVPDFGSTSGKIFGGIIAFNNSDPSTQRDLAIAFQDEHRKQQGGPWAKFYSLPLPVKIFSGDVFTVEKQDLVYGLTMQTNLSLLTFNITTRDLNTSLGECVGTTCTGWANNATLIDNTFVYGLVPLATGNYTIHVLANLGTAAAPRWYADSQDVVVVALPDLSVESIIPPANPIFNKATFVNASVKNNDPSEKATILAYDPANPRNTLEPVAFFYQSTSQTGTYSATAFVPPLDPLQSQLLSFGWTPPTIYPVNVTVCVAYVKYKPGAPRDPANPANYFVVQDKDQSNNCKALGVKAGYTVVPAVPDLGLVTTLNQSQFDFQKGTMNVTSRVTNYNDTISASFAWVYGFITKDGFLVANTGLGILPSTGQNVTIGPQQAKEGYFVYDFASGSSYTYYYGTKQLYAQFGTLQPGNYVITTCVIGGAGSPIGQDADGHPNCDQDSFTISPPVTPPGPFPGEKKFFPTQPQPGAPPLSPANAINIPRMVALGQYKEAAEALVEVPRSDEPSEEVLQFNFTLGPGGSDWTAFVAKGLYAEDSAGKTLIDKTSQMQVFLYEADADVSSIKPWDKGSFAHGWVDYKVALTGYDAQNRETLDSTTAVLVGQVLRKDAANPAGVALGINEVDNNELQAAGNFTYAAGWALTPPDPIKDAVYLTNFGYDKDNDGVPPLLLPIDNTRKTQFVRFLPSLFGGALQPGILTLVATGQAFGTITGNFTVGGLEVSPSVRQDWDFNNAPSYSQTFTLTNRKAAPVTLGTPTFIPGDVISRYQLLMRVDQVYDKFGVPLGANAPIPSDGRAELTVTGSAGPLCSGAAVAWLTIPFDSQDARVQFALTCPGAAPAVVPSDAWVVREEKPPSSVNVGTRSCDVEPGTGGAKSIARVCDAEQFTLALLRDVEAGATEVKYALGAETVTVATMDRALDEWASADVKAKSVFLAGKATDTAQKEVWFASDNIGCGLVTLKFDQLANNQGGDILVTPTVDNTAKWCGQPSHSYVMGLLNYDEKLRGKLASAVNFYGIKSDAGYDVVPFLVSMQQATLNKPFKLDQLLGYNNPASFADIVKNAQVGYKDRRVDVKYREIYKTEIPADSQFDYLRQTVQNSNEPFFGYFFPVRVANGVEVEIGLVSQEDYRNDPTRFKAARDWFAGEVIEFLVRDGSVCLDEPSPSGPGSVCIIGAARLGKAPTADAGPDQILPAGVLQVTLDGSKSKDADGNIVEYKWVLNQSRVIEAEEYNEKSGATIQKEGAASQGYELTIKIDSNKVSETPRYRVSLPQGDLDISVRARAGSCNDHGVGMRIGTFFDATAGPVTGTAYNVFTFNKRVSIGAAGDFDVELFNDPRTSAQFGCTVVVDWISFGAKTVAVETSATPTKTVNLPEAGDYLVSLEVKDDDGLVSAPDTMLIYGGPAADLTLSKAELAGKSGSDALVKLTIDNAAAPGYGIITQHVNPTSTDCSDIAKTTPTRPASTGQVDASKEVTVAAPVAAKVAFVLQGTGARTVSCQVIPTGEFCSNHIDGVCKWNLQGPGEEKDKCTSGTTLGRPGTWSTTTVDCSALSGGSGATPGWACCY
jgi:hypothetical protein